MNCQKRCIMDSCDAGNVENGSNNSWICTDTINDGAPRDLYTHNMNILEPEAPFGDADHDKNTETVPNNNFAAAENLQNPGVSVHFSTDSDCEANHVVLGTLVNGAYPVLNTEPGGNSNGAAVAPHASNSDILLALTEEDHANLCTEENFQSVVDLNSDGSNQKQSSNQVIDGIIKPNTKDSDASAETRESPTDFECETPSDCDPRVLSTFKVHMLAPVAPFDGADHAMNTEPVAVNNFRAAESSSAVGYSSKFFDCKVHRVAPEAMLRGVCLALNIESDANNYGAAGAPDASNLDILLAATEGVRANLCTKENFQRVVDLNSDGGNQNPSSNQGIDGIIEPDTNDNEANAETREGPTDFDSIVHGVTPDATLSCFSQPFTKSNGAAGAPHTSCLDILLEATEGGHVYLCNANNSISNLHPGTNSTGDTVHYIGNAALSKDVRGLDGWMTAITSDESAIVGGLDEFYKTILPDDDDPSQTIIVQLPSETMVMYEINDESIIEPNPELIRRQPVDSTDVPLDLSKSSDSNRCSGQISLEANLDELQSSINQPQSTSAFARFSPIIGWQSQHYRSAQDENEMFNEGEQQPSFTFEPQGTVFDQLNQRQLEQY